jgi:hypothetical protein
MGRRPDGKGAPLAMPQFKPKEHPVKASVNRYLSTLATSLVNATNGSSSGSGEEDTPLLWSFLLETQELLTLNALLDTIPGSFGARSAVCMYQRIVIFVQWQACGVCVCVCV